MTGFAHPFLFLRHGETEWNRIGRCQGQLDVGLNATGRAQAEAAAAALAETPIARVACSTLGRARDTAAAVAGPRGAPVTYDPDLRECHLGVHQGRLHGSWTPDYWRGVYAPPGGETFEAFAARVWAAMARAVARGPETLIVAHGGLWRAAKAHVRVISTLDRMPNAIPVRVTPEAGGAVWRAEPLMTPPAVIVGGDVFGAADRAP